LKSYWNRGGGVNAFRKRYEELKSGDGISYAKIGEAVGLDRTSIFKILQEKVGCPFKVAMAIGKALNMSEQDTIKAWKDIGSRLMDREIAAYKASKIKPKPVPRRKKTAE
jgi:DNA-binding XRE family transcriptional regulator